MPSSHGLWRGTVEIFVTAEVFFILAECNGRRRLQRLDQWESEFFVSRDDDSKQTLNWSREESLDIKHSLLSTDQFYDWLSLWWIGCDNSGDFKHTIASCPSGHDWGLKYGTATTQLRYFVVINGVKLQLFGFLLGWLKTEIWNIIVVFLATSLILAFITLKLKEWLSVVCTCARIQKIHFISYI